MKNSTYTDNSDIVLSIHKSLGNGYVIHLTDPEFDEPFDTIAYRLELHDIDDIIKDLKRIKKQMQADDRV